MKIQLFDKCKFEVVEFGFSVDCLYRNTNVLSLSFCEQVILLQALAMQCICM